MDVVRALLALILGVAFGLWLMNQPRLRAFVERLGSGKPWTW